MQPLVPQRTSFPIVAGQEQGVAPELIDPPVLTLAHNCYYNRAGELTKRRGWATAIELVSGYPYLPIPEKLAVRGNEVLWIGGTYGSLIEEHEPISIFSRAPAESAEDSPPTPWRNKGPIACFSSRKLLELSHFATGRRVEYWDCAFAGNDGPNATSEGVVCAAWRTFSSSDGNDIGRVEFAVLDVKTRSVLYQATITTTAYSDTIVRVVACKHSDGDWYFHIFYIVESGDTDYGDAYRVLVPASRPWEASDPAQFAADVSNFDVCVNDVDAVEHRFFLVYTLPTSGDYLRAIEYLPTAAGALTAVGSTSMLLDVIANCIAVYWSLAITCDPEGNEIGCHLAHTSTGCVGSPGNIFATFKAAVAPTHSLTAFDNIQSAGTDDSAAGGDGGCQIVWAGTHMRDGVERSDNFWISWERNAPNDQGLLYQLSYSVAAAPLVLEVPRGNTATRRPWGRPFWFRGQSYLPTVQGSTSDTCVLEVVAPYRAGITEGDPATAYRVVARALSGEIGFVGNPQSYPRAKGHNSFVESYYQRGRFFSIVPVVSTDGTANNLALIDLDAREPYRYGHCQIDGGTYFASSIPWCYDGGLGHELGFPSRPQAILGEIEAIGATSINPMPAGDYYVAACWEATDALGRRAQSAPSFTGKVTVATGETIEISFLNLCVTSHKNARLVVYVSNDGGVNFIRSKQVIENWTYQATERVVQLTEFELFLDGMPTLYTNQGILSNGTLPSARFVCEWQGRVWLANNRDVYPSRELVDGEEPAFNESLRFQVHHDITGIIGFDDRLVIWHANGLYWVSGDGPTDTGEGGSFSQPQRVPTDFGCIDARSIVRTSKGILYQSVRGIELLDQTLAPRSEPISSGIDRILKEDGFSTVLTSSWDPRFSIARFVLQNATGLRVIAQWHAQFELWTTSGVPVVANGRVDTSGDLVHAFGRNWLAVFDSPPGPSLYNPMCYLLTEKLPGESNLYIDGAPSAPFDYQMVVETANVKLEGLTGFVRVRRAYVLVKDLYQSQTGFRLGYFVDYSDSLVADKGWFTAEDVEACKTESDNHYRFGLHIAKQQCSAIRFIIKDSGALDSNDPYSYGLTLVGFGIEWGQKVGTGRGSKGSKK